jgi:2-polyprenyl-3-methyl-5-hydroxy-6-metoxy-1,4-benzoquinol methylase
MILDVPPERAKWNWVQLVRDVAPDVDVKRVLAIADATIRYVRTKHEDRRWLEPMQALQARWYASLDRGDPDYGVYADPDYLPDLWSCWIVYSRGYLRGLRTPQKDGRASVLEQLRGTRAIADIGCGFGYTSAALAELFPSAAVHSFDISGSPQFAIAATIAPQRRFAMHDTLSAIGPVDVVFASEYFEHHQSPIAHVRDVVATLRPRALLIANTFGSRSIGHFDCYLDVDGSLLDGKQTARAFARELRALGYEHTKTDAWNQRPMFWQRV